MNLGLLANCWPNQPKFFLQFIFSLQAIHLYMIWPFYGLRVFFGSNNLPKCTESIFQNWHFSLAFYALCQCTALKTSHIILAKKNNYYYLQKKLVVLPIAKLLRNIGVRCILIFFLLLQQTFLKTCQSQGQILVVTTCAIKQQSSLQKTCSGLR